MLRSGKSKKRKYVDEIDLHNCHKHYIEGFETLMLSVFILAFFNFHALVDYCMKYKLKTAIQKLYFRIKKCSGASKKRKYGD